MSYQRWEACASCYVQTGTGGDEDGRPLVLLTIGCDHGEVTAPLQLATAARVRDELQEHIDRLIADGARREGVA